MNGGRVSNSSMIDGFVDHGTFANLYKGIYADSDASDTLKSNLTESFNDYCTKESSESVSDYLFPWRDMTDLIFTLETGKATSTFIKAEHILYGCPELLHYLHLLFNSLLSHSYLPHNFLLGTISPIVKDSWRLLNFL